LEEVPIGKPCDLEEVPLATESRSFIASRGSLTPRANREEHVTLREEPVMLLPKQDNQVVPKNETPMKKPPVIEPETAIPNPETFEPFEDAFTFHSISHQNPAPLCSKLKDNHLQKPKKDLQLLHPGFFEQTTHNASMTHLLLHSQH
jgi:hypothetical protein